MELRQYWNILKIFVVLSSCRLLITKQHHIGEVRMRQVDEGIRTIGANVTIVTDFTFSCGKTVWICLYAENTKTKVEERRYHDCELEKTSIKVEEYPHLNISIAEDQSNMIKKVSATWYFSDLPEDYNGLDLISELKIQEAEDTEKVTLNVSACKSYTRHSTFHQNSTYYITSSESGYLGHKGECHCSRKNETLFHTNGTEANTTAICEYNANWSGCEKLQCWSAPHNVTAIQLNKTVGSMYPFDCSHTDGFPIADPDDIEYKIISDNKYLNRSYELKSADNGKYFSCKIISNYTLAMAETAESTPQEIIVYYPPEDLDLSNESVSLDINCSTTVNFSFDANPADRKVDVSFQYESNAGNNPDPQGVLSWTGCYVRENTHHIREFQVHVINTTDYGNYTVCAATSEPEQRSCTQFTIYEASKSPPPEREQSIYWTAIYVVSVVMVVASGVVLSVVIRKKIKKCAGNSKQNNENPMDSNGECTECEMNDRGPRYGETTATKPTYQNIEPSPPCEENEENTNNTAEDHNDGYQEMKVCVRIYENETAARPIYQNVDEQPTYAELEMDNRDTAPREIVPTQMIQHNADTRPFYEEILCPDNNLKPHFHCSYHKQ